MKFSLILLCSAAALLAAAPAWADRIDAGYAHEVDNQKLAAIVASHFALKLNAFQSDRFDASLMFRLADPHFSGTLGSVPLSRLDSSIDSANFAHFDFQGGDLPSSVIREPQSHEREGHNKSDGKVAAVPEPGSFSLLLLGLCGLGSFAYRRAREGSPSKPTTFNRTITCAIPMPPRLTRIGITSSGLRLKRVPYRIEMSFVNA